LLRFLLNPLAIFVRPYLPEIKANPAQFSRPKPISMTSIHVECVLVKFIDSIYKAIIFFALQAPIDLMYSSLQTPVDY